MITSLAVTVLSIAAALLCTWFTIHSTAFASMVQHKLDDETIPGVVSFGSLEWGPSWDEVTVYDLVLRDRSSKPILVAARAHVKIDLGQFHTARRELVLVLDEAEAHDFELTLRWTEHGKLTLADIFRGRSTGLKKEPTPDRKLRIDLGGIHLRKGRLHLEWPKFGFSFDAIDTDGTVRATIGDLDIDVPALDCAQGTAWVRGSPAWLSTVIGAHMPLNDMSRRAPEGLRIPFDRLAIRDFKWTKGGFVTDLKIQGTGAVPIWARGKMGFPEEGIEHALKLDLGMPAAFASAMTGGVVEGATTLRLSTEGRDLTSRVSVGPMDVPAVKLRKVAVEGLALRELTVDATGETARITVDTGAASIRAGELSGDAVSITAKAELGYKGWEVRSFLGSLLPPPSSAAGWLKVFPPARTRALVEVSRAKAERVTWKSFRWKEPLIDGLRASVVPDGLTPKVSAGGLATTAAGERIALSGKAIVSIFPPGVLFQLTFDLKNIPLPLIKEVVGEHERLAGQTGPVSGQLKVLIDPRGKERWRVSELAIAAPAPKPGTLPETQQVGTPP